MRVFKIIVYYHDKRPRGVMTIETEKVDIVGKVGGMTGHWVSAKSPEAAIDIANKHRIGNPMGIDDQFVKKRKADLLDKFNPSKKYGGKIWAEVNGELVGYDTPLRKPYTPYDQEDDGEID